MIELLEKKFKKDVIRLGFIKSSFKKVSSQLKHEVFDSLNEKWRAEEIQHIQDSTISEMEKKSDNKFVEVLIWQPKTNSKYVVFFTNMSDGWYTLLYHYASKYEEEVVSIKLSRKKIQYPVYSFGIQKGETERLVRSMKEVDKWEFLAKGGILDFEETGNYKKRKIADRMNNEIIIDYLNKLGINISDEEFWVSSKAVRFYTDLRE